MGSTNRDGCVDRGQSCPGWLVSAGWTCRGGGRRPAWLRCALHPPPPPRALLCPALQRYVVRQHQLPLLSEVYGTLSYVCSRVTGESPQMSSTCLGKKCSRTKTSSGQGCSLCSLTAAGKTYLRLAGNLGNRKREKSQDNLSLRTMVSHSVST